ncbi:PQQ-binding-like beta-propeller repeat protein [Symmachiella dynata]|uniref:PQQ-binding-like beta-propeller repeat protein n=1 Tax=Symmachiella dynata TaxID=2527995 RepID=UPI0030EB5E81
MKRNVTIFASCGIIVFLTSAALRAENWPQFRGPTRQGISSEVGLPVEWDAETGENIAWKQTVPGKGWSSPVVVNGRIYLTTAVADGDGDNPDHSLRVLCLDAKSGEEIWNVGAFQRLAADSERIHPKNSHASPTPIVDAGQIFVHFGTHGTACLNLDGTFVWKTTELVYEPQHGSGGSPALVDDVLVISCDGRDKQYIACLDRNDGEIRWKVNRDTFDADKKFAFHTPLAIDVNGRKQVVSTGANSVSGFDVQTGEAIWTVRHDGYSVVPRPVFAHGLVFICTSFQRSSLLAIRPDGQGDVTETHVAWKSNDTVSHSPSPIIVGDNLYMVSDRGVASCRDARSGDLHWKKRVNGSYSASPIFADGHLYFQSEQGDGVVIKPGETFEVVARNSIGEPTLASYAVSEGALFVRSENQLYRIQQDERR